MFTPEEIKVISLISLWIVAIFAPAMLGETIFKKPGREVIAAICFIVTATAWSSAWVIGLVDSIVRKESTGVTAFSTFLAIGLVMIGFAVAKLVIEIKRRSKIAT